MHSGPEDGAKLRLEDLRIIQAKADCTTSQERVFLMAQIEAISRLVSSDVERADDDSMWCDSFGHMPVHGILLLLIGRDCSVEVKKLGPVKTDPLSSSGRHLVKFLGEFNIGGENDVASVERGGIDFPKCLKPLLNMLLGLSQGLVGLAGGMGWIEEKLAAVAIHQDDMAVLKGVTNTLQSDDCRDSEGPRHDCRMGCLAPLFGDKSGDIIPVECRRVGGSQFVGHNDVIPVVTRQALTRFTHEVTDNPSADILQVDGSFPQIGIINSS